MLDLTLIHMVTQKTKTNTQILHLLSQLPYPREDQMGLRNFRLLKIVYFRLLKIFFLYIQIPH